jgi:outer membrane protein OmpA-like peptidoglycan-associated protein
MFSRIAGFILTMWLPSALAITENCATLESTLRQSLEHSQIGLAQSQLQTLSTACPGSPQLKSAERYFTDVIARKSNDLANQNRLQEAEALLDQAKTLSWSVSTVRGDIAAKRKNWKEAAQQYGQAFELLTDPTHTTASDIPNLKELQIHIHQLATDAQLIYGKLDTTITRGGKPTGIFSGLSRGFHIERTALPVHFETGKADLTPDGLQSAQALTDFIRGQSGKITVIGFADPRGKDKDNLKLSLNRAKTISDYLKNHGVDLPIESIGKGESAPPNSAIENLTQEEQYARWRRVEIKLENP